MCQCCLVIPTGNRPNERCSKRADSYGEPLLCPLRSRARVCAGCPHVLVSEGSTNEREPCCCYGRQATGHIPNISYLHCRLTSTCHMPCLTRHALSLHQVVAQMRKELQRLNDQAREPQNTPTNIRTSNAHIFLKHCSERICLSKQIDIYAPHHSMMDMIGGHDGADKRFARTGLMP